MKVGYIYLIREREFLYRGEPVYKIGRGEQEPDNKIKRLVNYKKGSHIEFACGVEAEKVSDIETDVKRALGEVFQQHSDGHEYFIGDPIKMKLLTSFTSATAP
jgi:hypothetical protein